MESHNGEVMESHNGEVMESHNGEVMESHNGEVMESQWRSDGEPQWRSGRESQMQCVADKEKWKRARNRIISQIHKCKSCGEAEMDKYYRTSVVRYTGTPWPWTLSPLLSCFLRRVIGLSQTNKMVESQKWNSIAELQTQEAQMDKYYRTGVVRYTRTPWPRTLSPLLSSFLRRVVGLSGIQDALCL